MRAKDRTGILGEELASAYLQRQGHAVLERRWRVASGEIDLITAEGEFVVAVEVKTRRGLGYGHPFESIDAKKVQRVQRLLLDYLARQEMLAAPHRVDAISVLLQGEGVKPRIEHLKGVPR